MEINESIKSALTRFGLSESEVKVYLAAVKQDDTTPFKLAKLTGIPRTTVYDTLMSLSLKGLVVLSSSDGFSKQQTLVRAKNPSAFRTILQNKRKELLSVESDILEILPEIKQEYNKGKANSDFMFYPGIEGARKIYSEMMSKEETELDIPSYAWDLQMPMDAFGVDETNKMVSSDNSYRLRRKNFSRELSPLNDWTRHVISYQYERDPDYLTNLNLRVVEKSGFEVFLRMEIKGDWFKAVCAHEDEMWGLKIRSKFFAGTLKSIFNLNWDLATVVTPELIKSWGPNEFLQAQVRDKRTSARVKAKKNKKV